MGVKKAARTDASVLAPDLNVQLFASATGTMHLQTHRRQPNVRNTHVICSTANYPINLKKVCVFGEGGGLYLL